MNEMAVIELLEKLHLILKRHGEYHWSNEIRSILNSRMSNKRERALGWFGRMGSFSDLYISSLNGHEIEPSEEDQVNSEIEKLREQLYRQLRQRGG